MLNLFFIIHNYSGARTYANELLGYLATQQGIAVHKVYLNSPDYKEYTVIEDENILNIHIPQVKRQPDTLEKYASRCIDLMEPLLRNKTKIIFHLNYSTQVKFGLEAQKRFGAVLVYTLHFLPNYFSYMHFDDSISNDLTTTGDVLDKEIVKTVDRIICISAFAQKAICEQYHTEVEHTVLIPNGYGRANECGNGSNRAALKKSFGFRADERIVLFVGRLEMPKGVHELIHAFEKVSARFPDVRLVFAGKGSYDEILKSCRNITGKVTFTGRLGKEELQKIYGIADIGVVPSRFELLGYIPIEMMRYEVPVIISDVPGMNELIDDGKHGLVCKTKIKPDGLLGLEVDEQELYNKIATLLNNKNLAGQLARNGRLSWEQNYTASHMGDKTLKLYKQLLKQNAKKEKMNTVKA